MKTPRVYLDHVRLRDYRSCQDTSFSPDANLTALIGPNGSGKTNVLQGLMLLCASNFVPQRDEDDTPTLRAKVSASFRVNNRLIELRASIVYRETEQNRDVLVFSKEKWNFKSITGRDTWVQLNPYYRYHHSRYQRRPGSSDEPAFYITDAGSGSLRILTRDRLFTLNKLPSSVGKVVDAINAFRESAGYYSASQFTNPSLCPSSLEIDPATNAISVPGRITGPARIHSQFLHRLYLMYKDQRELYSTYLSLVDNRGLKLIETIEWKETKFSSHSSAVRRGKLIQSTRPRLLLVPTIYVGDSQLTFSQLSEGTYRTLAILFHLMTDKSNLLLIEEPEVCVHHGLLTSIVDLIKDYALEKQIIFSTHSESILDRVEPERVRLVTKAKDGTKVKPISKSMSARQFHALKRYLESEGNLGEYWRHSGFQE